MIVDLMLSMTEEMRMILYAVAGGVALFVFLAVLVIYVSMRRGMARMKHANRSNHAVLEEALRSERRLSVDEHNENKWRLDTLQRQFNILEGELRAEDEVERAAEKAEGDLVRERDLERQIADLNRKLGEMEGDIEARFGEMAPAVIATLGNGHRPPELDFAPLSSMLSKLDSWDPVVDVEGEIRDQSSRIQRKLEMTPVTSLKLSDALAINDIRIREIARVVNGAYALASDVMTMMEELAETGIVGRVNALETALDELKGDEPTIRYRGEEYTPREAINLLIDEVTHAGSNFREERILKKIKSVEVDLYQLLRGDRVSPDWRVPPALRAELDAITALKDRNTAEVERLNAALLEARTDFLQRLEEVRDAVRAVEGEDGQPRYRSTDEVADRLRHVDTFVNRLDDRISEARADLIGLEQRINSFDSAMEGHERDHALLDDHVLELNNRSYAIEARVNSAGALSSTAVTMAEEARERSIRVHQAVRGSGSSGGADSEYALIVTSQRFISICPNLTPINAATPPTTDLPWRLIDSKRDGDGGIYVAGTEKFVVIDTWGLLRADADLIFEAGYERHLENLASDCERHDVTVCNVQGLLPPRRPLEELDETELDARPNPIEQITDISKLVSGAYTFPEEMSIAAIVEPLAEDDDYIDV